MCLLIQVCGDPTVDWFRIHHDDVTVHGGVYYWQRQDEDSRVRLSSKPGGSALILELLNEMISPQIARVEGAILDDDLLKRPKDRCITTSWTLWKEFANPGLHQNSFRLWKWHEFETGNWDYPSARLSGYPDLLLIQDSGLGFSHCPAGWPEVLTGGEKSPAHIILKLGQYNNGQENPLLSRIIELGLAQKTTIVSSLSDLRACAVKVGISLSWERMLEEVVKAVLSPSCPFADSTGKNIKYHQVIVPIGLSGAVIVGQKVNTLIFDRRGQEGDFASQFPGQIIGDNSCIIGALAVSWAENPEGVDWTEATRIGLELARLLHIKGYDVVEHDEHKHLQFPYQTMVYAYQELKTGKKSATGLPLLDLVSELGIFVDDKNTARSKPGRWTILEDALWKNLDRECCVQDPQSIRAVNELARNIVVNGPQAALLNVPVETVGAWSSADRQEIEGVRSVNNAMRDYLRLKRPEKPICVAVFGQPGAGKSFVIKEIAKGLGIGEDAQLTFNLSQFDSAEELQTAFDQVRDLNLKGKMPLVFWDEFDTPCQGQPLGWLRYFLAPMQDGEFTYQGLPHPLGGGIYVFAGATRHSFEEFSERDSSSDRAAKKPDFISRLRAFINIRGINGNPNTVEDRLYMIRRAFILRQSLESNAPQIMHSSQFEIDSGVLDAFLLTTRYRHGSRSLENLLKMSSLADKRKYELSSLPPDHIIEMHVNMKEFNDLTYLGHREMLRIGITGHVNLDPEEMDILKEAVDHAIAYIKQEYPEHYLTVFSPLALGADRLVARELLKIEASRLIAVLPYALEQYINDFGISDDYRTDPQGAELRNEFNYWLSNRAIEVIEMPLSPTRQTAYLKTGHYIADHSDVIMVVWDGNRRKYSSVTAQIVGRAEEMNIPICHIWASNNRPESCQAQVASRPGEIRCKNFPDQNRGEWKNI
ncbi:MAG TPA: hypothetical protein VN426_12080 [Syntrophomonadaceae bacterium]|nr:hypothetical protein [Syntrophomonadaceae bacterium]